MHGTQCENEDERFGSGAVGSTYQLQKKSLKTSNTF